MRTFIFLSLFCVSFELWASESRTVADEVYREVAVAGEARVMIALAHSPELRSALRAASRERVHILIEQRRDALLADLTPDDFRLHQTYKSVAALAGDISASGLNKLAAHPLVRRIDPDVGGGGGLAVSVPLVRADDWQAHGVNGGGIVIAVLDSGFDSAHPDLAGALVGEACFLDFDGSINGTGRCPNGSDRQIGDGSAVDDNNHGTWVSGVITSDGVVASRGAAPGTSIVAVKVLDFNNSFNFYSEVVAALDYVYNNRPEVDIINMSLGTNAMFLGACDASTSYNIAGFDIVNLLVADGVTTIASAGNQGSATQMQSPACLSNVIAVGASTKDDAIASFSNRNEQTDIFAPGAEITTSARGGGSASVNGTSFAAPHVAACAALLRQSGIAVTPQQIRTRLSHSNRQLFDAASGLTFSRLDCFGFFDVNNDGNIGSEDLGAMMSHWLGADESADINADGKVNATDMGLWLDIFLNSGP